LPSESPSSIYIEVFFRHQENLLYSGVQKYNIILTKDRMIAI